MKLESASRKRLRATLALIGLVWTGAANAQNMNGTVDPLFYGVPRVTQNNQTGFGKNTLTDGKYADGSELDAGYAQIRNGRLNLFIAGNLQTNDAVGSRNRIYVFVDSASGGQNRLRGDNTFGGSAWQLTRMGDSGGSNGLKFDAAFSPDHVFVFDAGYDQVAGDMRMNVNYSPLPAASGGAASFLGAAAPKGQTGGVYDYAGKLVGGSNSSDVRATINNGNVVGVTGGNGAWSGTPSTTGIELSIPLSLLNWTYGDIRVSVILANAAGDSLSNQMLGGLGGKSNIGEPRGVVLSSATYPGNQFFAGGRTVLVSKILTTSPSAAVTLEEYSATGVGQDTALSSVAIPSSGGNKLVISGTASSEGFVTKSIDGNLITIAGYSTDAGASNPITNGSSRVAASLDQSGLIVWGPLMDGTQTYLNGNNRSGFTNDGARYWFGGNASSFGGVRSAVPNGQNVVQSVSVSSGWSVTNVRNVNTFAGNLYASTGSAPAGIFQIGVGLPDTGGQTATSVISTVGTGSGTSSPYDFLFADANTCYIADDRSIANGGGVQKWTKSGGAWTLAYTLKTNLTSGCRGITGYQSGSNWVLFVVTADNTTKLATVVDTGASSAFDVLATAPANNAFRGVEMSFQTDVSPNNPPVAQGQSIATNEDAATGILLSATDPENDPLTYEIVAGPANGTLAGTPPNVTYTPNADYFGGDSFTFRAKDTSNAYSNVATVNITVNPVNDPPSFVSGGDTTVDEDSGAYSVTWATDISPGPANESSQTVSFQISGNTNTGLFTVQPSIDSSGALTFTPAPDASGAATMQVLAKDNGGTANNGADTSAPVTLVITVNPVNDAPEIAPISDQAVDEQTPFSVTAQGSDPKDNPPNALTYSLQNAPNGMSLDPATGKISWTPTEADGPGDYSVTVRVTDDGTPAESAETSFNVHVNEVNTAPVLDPLTDQTVNENTAVTFTATASDSDIPGNGLSFSLDGAPDGASIDPVSGTFTWTPSEEQGGNPQTVYTFSVVVTDNGDPAMSDSKSVTITVKEVNTAPTVDPISDQSGQAGTPISFTATASDSDLPAQALSFSLSGAPSGATIDPQSGEFSWTPSSGGTFEFDVVATDDGPGTLSGSTRVKIVVETINSAPVLDPIADQTVDELTLLQLTATASDPDSGQTLTFSIDPGAPDGASIDPATGVFSWTPSEAQGPGAYSITVRVTDNGNPQKDDAKTFNVTVNEVNAAPTLSGVPSAASVDELAAYTFAASATDSDLPANGLTFTLVGAPDGASIDPQSGVFTWTPSEAQGPGVYAFQVRVTDDGNPNLFDEKSIAVTVREVNSAPVMGPISDKTIDEMVAFSFTPSATDSDLPANRLTWSLVSGPTGSSVDATSGKFSWTPAEDQGPGEYTVILKVADDGDLQLSDEKSFKITVKEVNREPVLAPIGDKTVDELSNLAFSASASDPDLPSNGLTFSLIGAPTGATIDPSTGVFNWTPADDQGNAQYTFTVKVTDDGSLNLSDEETITVTVRGVNIVATIRLAGVDATFVRGLEFTVGGVGGGSHAPVSLTKDVQFQNGEAVVTFGASDGIPVGSKITKLSVKDPLHTVRKTVSLIGSDGNFTADFTLLSGDSAGAEDPNNPGRVIGDNMVDVLDYGAFAAHFGENPGADTPIGFAPTPHSDFSGNGQIETSDFTYILTNYLQVGDPLPGSFDIASDRPKKQVTITEMVKRAGVRKAIAARMDGNGDGIITTDEITRWLQENGKKP